MPHPPFALNLGFVFLLQFLGMQPLKPLSYIPLFHLPALPDRRQAGGDFVVVQRLRPGARSARLCGAVDLSDVFSLIAER